MAKRDYICCSECDDKIFYDGNDSAREALESKFGDSEAKYWTVKLVCPTCLTKLCAKVTSLEAENEKLSLYKNLADEYGLSVFADLAELNARIEDRDAALLNKTIELAECQKQRDELMAALERIGAWLEIRNLGGLMPLERELIVRAKEKLGEKK